jgi:hypothetical protein
VAASVGWSGVDIRRLAVNPLTGGIFPQTYIGDIVPGTGNSCLN